MNIKYNFYYLGIESFLFDSSILFSINYKDTIQFNDSVTFLSFENIEDFYFAKKLFSTKMNQINKNYIIKNIIFFDQEDFSNLFPTQEISINTSSKKLFFIMFRIRYINPKIKNKKWIKDYSFLKKDLT